jgi:hypothetical protein
MGGAYLWGCHNVTYIEHLPRTAVGEDVLQRGEERPNVVLLSFHPFSVAVEGMVVWQNAPSAADVLQERERESSIIL